MILKNKLEPPNEGYALSKIVTTRLYISQEDPTFLYKLSPIIYTDCSHLIPALIDKIHIANMTYKTIVNI